MRWDKAGYVPVGNSMYLYVNANDTEALRKGYVRFEVFTAVTMKNAVSGMLRRVALVRTDVSEEPGASIIRVKRIGELGKTLAVTSKRCKLRRSNIS
jgi:hypothetical protein